MLTESQTDRCHCERVNTASAILAPGAHSAMLADPTASAPLAPDVMTVSIMVFPPTSMSQCMAAWRNGEGTNVTN